MVFVLYYVSTIIDLSQHYVKSDFFHYLIVNVPSTAHWRPRLTVGRKVQWIQRYIMASVVNGRPEWPRRKTTAELLLIVPVFAHFAVLRPAENCARPNQNIRGPAAGQKVPPPLSACLFIDAGRKHSEYFWTWADSFPWRPVSGPLGGKIINTTTHAGKC